MNPCDYLLANAPRFPGAPAAYFCPMWAIIRRRLLSALLLLLLTYLGAWPVVLAQAVAEDPVVAAQQPPSWDPFTHLRVNVHRVDGPLKFKVNYENPAGGFVEIRLLDQQGNVLRKDLFLHTPRKVTLYDLSFLADGIYTFEVSTLLEKYSQGFHIQQQVVRAVRPVRNHQRDEGLTLYRVRLPDKP